MGIKKSSILHLRIPFSLYLMPFFLFALTQAEIQNKVYPFIAFIALHLFLYPASNGYNSYFDKDEESIGGLEKPPIVEKELFYIALLFDVAAILLAFLISWKFALLLFLYGMVSKAYSHPIIRLKKMPFVGLLTVVVFQGFFTYAMTVLAIENLDFSAFFVRKTLFPGLLCSLLLLGSYPITQVYQHREDAKRGDLTLSRLIGIKGTFIWTASLFCLATIAFVYYFFLKYNLWIAMLFPFFMLPTFFYFLQWTFKVFKDEKNADWKSTMQLNKLSTYSFIAFFLFLFFYKF